MKRVFVDFPEDGAKSEDSDFSDDDQMETFANSDGDDDDSTFDSDDDIPLSEVREVLRTKSQGKTKITWKKDSLVLPEEEIRFSGSNKMPDEVKRLRSPYEFFKFFFTEEILQFIVDETILYSTQVDVSKPQIFTKHDIEQFIGICFYMSIIQLPSTRDYWSRDKGYPAIYNTMSRQKWENIKHFLHFNDNTTFMPPGQPGHDKLHKVRPLLEMLRKRLFLLPKEEYIAVDEQIIPTKSRSTIKQYNPKKPHKWGYKNFVLSGISGFCYDFEISCGQQDNIRMANAPDLGASSNVVVRLTMSVPRNVRHKVFFDNWFTSIRLQIYLQSQGILSLGTVRANRLPGIKLPTEPEMKKLGRGSMVEKTTTVDNVKLSVVSWYDNKIVNLLSTFAGSQPQGQKRRFFRSEKCYKMIPCPHSVDLYNKYMGGVDLLDSMLGYYRIKIRSKKWYHKIAFHMFDMMLINSWLLWRKMSNSDLRLSQYKLEVAEALCKASKPVYSRRRGRPSTVSQREETKPSKKRRPSTLPTKQVQFDGFEHFPIWGEKRERCKNSTCNAQTYVECEKCHVSLCFNKDRNCFKYFHCK